MVSVNAVGIAFWAGKQLRGGGGKRANTSSIKQPDGSVWLVDYNWAVYAVRKSNGHVTIYDGWHGYSATTSKHFTQLGLHATGANIVHKNERKETRY